jgi:hypothetical protein
MNTDDLGYQTIIFADVNKRQYAVKAYDLALVRRGAEGHDKFAERLAKREREFDAIGERLLGDDYDYNQPRDVSNAVGNMLDKFERNKDAAQFWKDQTREMSNTYESNRSLRDELHKLRFSLEVKSGETLHEAARRLIRMAEEATRRAHNATSRAETLEAKVDRYKGAVDACCRYLNAKSPEALVSKVGFVAKLDRLYERVENTRAGGVATRLVNLFTWDGPF